MHQIGKQNGFIAEIATNSPTPQFVCVLKSKEGKFQMILRNARHGGRHFTVNASPEDRDCSWDWNLGCRKDWVIVGNVRSLRKGRDSIMAVVRFDLCSTDCTLRQALTDLCIIGYHGKAKVRKYEGNYWTHTSRGGAFGREIWKRWFNNRAMNNLEVRLSTERPEQHRKGSERYAMRTLEAKEVDTQEVRDSHASTYPHYRVRRRHGLS